MSENLKSFLGCPCTEIPGDTSRKKIMELYQAARVRGEKESFLPVLISDSDWEEADDIRREKSPEEYLEELRAAMPDGKTFLAQQGKYFRRATLGPMKGGEVNDGFTAIGGNLVLAEIPAEHPWEIFAWMPFGGWNDCPSDEELMAAAKYWFEQYGAVPAVLTRDGLEFDLPAPVPKERAMELAMEQYTFCSDIVDQGCESIGALADTLWQSSKWFFWWD